MVSRLIVILCRVIWPLITELLNETDPVNSSVLQSSDTFLNNTWKRGYNLENRNNGFEIVIDAHSNMVTVYFCRFRRNTAKWYRNNDEN